MLNQLIESKDHKAENSRKNSFLVSVLGFFIILLLTGWTYSLFAKNFGMGTGDFELSSLVAPVAVTDDAPPPKPEPKIERTQTRESGKIILKDLYADIATTKIPPKDLTGVKDVVSAEKFNPKDIEIGAFNQIPANPGRTNGATNEQGCGLCRTETDNDRDKDTEDKAPEITKPTPKPSPTKPPTPSLGVVNGRATFLAMPPYPPAAKLVKAQGAVNVQVLIDETGKVVSASAVSGHPLLRAVSENAARQSRFTPTLLSNQPVKVTGVIVYKFVP